VGKRKAGSDPRLVFWWVGEDSKKTNAAPREPASDVLGHNRYAQGNEKNGMDTKEEYEKGPKSVGAVQKMLSN